MFENSDFRLVGVMVLTVATGIWVGCSEVDAPMLRPLGSVDVTTVTVGEDLDPNGYILSVDSGVGPTIGANATVTVSELRTGEHDLELTNVATNCAVEGDNPRTVRAQATEPLQTTFRVNCTVVREITIESGQSQVGHVGTILDEPFVVRVTDSRGAGVENVEVKWTVPDTPGGAGALDGRFDDKGDPVISTVTRTDTDGRTHVTFMPTSFRVIQVYACVTMCQDDRLTFTTDATDPAATLAIVSGNDQQAKAGQVFAEPFVVRVTNGEGDGVPHVGVYWQITYGEGAMTDGEGAVLWDEWGHPIRETYTRTGPDGLAHASPIATWFGPIDVDASLPRVQGLPVTFTGDAIDYGATITIVSGNEQAGKAGEPLAEPFVVRVTDGQGTAAANIHVSWSVTSEGKIAEVGLQPKFVLGYPSGPATRSTYTRTDGLADVSFWPVALGTGVVTAQPAGIHARVTLNSEVTVQAIPYYVDEFAGEPLFAWIRGGCDYDYDGWCPDDWDVSDVSVPIGTTVEWVNYLPSARIVATTVPPGGTRFDTSLSEGERFQFVPEVAGTWEYVDPATGARGSLRAY